MGVSGSMPHPGCCTPWGRDLVPILLAVWWAPWTVWMGLENSAPTRIQSWDHPARSESLYRPRYPGPPHKLVKDSAAIIHHMYNVNVHVSHKFLKKRLHRIPPIICLRYWKCGTRNYQCTVSYLFFSCWLPWLPCFKWMPYWYGTVCVIIGVYI